MEEGIKSKEKIRPKIRFHYYDDFGGVKEKIFFTASSLGEARVIAGTGQDIYYTVVAERGDTEEREILIGKDESDLSLWNEEKPVHAGHDRDQYRFINDEGLVEISYDYKKFETNAALYRRHFFR